VLDLVLADARTPSGSFAASGGLEAAVRAGLAATEVPRFIRARLRTVGVCEASLAVAALGCGSVEGLLALDLEPAARTPAEPLRRVSAQLGRGLLRTASMWFPDHAVLAGYRSRSVLTPRPVVLGAVARAAGGVDPLALARVSLYEDAATVASAAVKLLPLDAAVTSAWVVALAAEIGALAATAVAAAAVGDLPSTATPLLDERAMEFATTDRRLFVS
jgi:urease accessory protein